jgi:enolase
MAYRHKKDEKRKRVVKIVNITAREIFDSRGIPTVECEIYLDDGMVVTSSAPSGISRSIYEAHEVRDGGSRLNGYGVQSVVKTIEEVIAPMLIGRKPDVIAMDIDMVERDGTDNKSCLGSNATLPISIGICKAQAYIESVALYELIADFCDKDIVAVPCPMFNLLGGGAHVNNGCDIQEYMIVPTGAASFQEAMDIGVSIFYALRDILKAKKHTIAYGYEGELVASFRNNLEACDLIMEAIEKCSYSSSVMISLDVAASHFYSMESGLYRWEGNNVIADDLIKWYQQIVKDYPIYSIEDGLSQVDWKNWKIMKEVLANSIKLVGDDLFATNPQRIWDGIENDVATTVIIKPDQIGTLTETLQSINLCHEAGWDVIISHRSGETNDSFISDLAVGSNASHIKAGNCFGGERVAKYNRLLAIENEFFMDSCI